MSSTMWKEAETKKEIHRCITDAATGDQFILVGGGLRKKKLGFLTFQV